MTTVEQDYTDRAATFGDRLALAREARSMTQAQLARRLGLRGSTIANWEQDRSEPRANKLQMLAGVLSVSIIWLMTGVGQGPMLAGGSGDLTAGEVLPEVRELRQAQQALIERLSRLEARLGAAAGGD